MEKIEEDEDLIEVVLTYDNENDVRLELESGNKHPPEEGDDDEEADGTNGVVWPTGVKMAIYLTSQVSEESESSPKGKSVLELGSGLGIGGLAAAIGGAKKVTFTDIPSALPALKFNVLESKIQKEVFETIFPGAVPEFDVSPLRWGEDAEIEAKNYDLVIGSDLLYNADMIPVLTETMKGAKRILMAVRWRKPELERNFFKIMEESHGYKFKLVSDTNGFLPCVLDWKEYGNPECDESNQYFRSTMIAVSVLGENPIPLADIDEEQREHMNDDEYDMYETFLTQIYEGVLEG